MMNKIRQKTASAVKSGKAPAKLSTRKVKQSVISPDSDINQAASFSAEDRLRMIAEAAYNKAEKRGFIAGDETECWLEAESEIDALIATGTVSSQQRPATLQ